MDERDRGLQGLGPDDREVQVRVEKAAQLVGEDDRGRIRDCEQNRPVWTYADGKCREAASGVLAQSSGEPRIEIGYVEIRVRQLVLLCEQLCDLRWRRDVSLDEDLSEAPAGDAVLAGILLLGEDRLQNVLRDDSVSYQEDAERWPAVPCGFHRSNTSAGRRKGFTRGGVVETLRLEPVTPNLSIWCSRSPWFAASRT